MVGTTLWGWDLHGGSEASLCRESQERCLRSAEAVALDPGAEAPSPRSGSVGATVSRLVGSQGQGKAEGAQGARRRRLPRSPGSQGGPSPGSHSLCGVSTQLKTQLERTEALLEDEQTQRQKLTAEFEEVRPCLCSPWGIGDSGGAGRGLPGGLALSLPAGRGGVPHSPLPRACGSRLLSLATALIPSWWASPGGLVGPVGPVGCVWRPAHAPLPSLYTKAQSSACRLQTELEKLRSMGPLESSEAEEATRLKVRGPGGSVPGLRVGSGKEHHLSCPGSCHHLPLSLRAVGAILRPLGQGPASFGGDGGGGMSKLSMSHTAATSQRGCLH